MPLRNRPARPATSVLAAIILLAQLVAGCGPANAPSSGSASLRPDSTPVIGLPGNQLTGDEAVAAYGLGPTRDPSVTYQPDVVLIEGGPSVIRWASEDGLTWAIDPSAPGAADLHDGSVMFATSVAVGRVVEIVDEGDSRVVTIAPIDLTDLVRDADIRIDEALDFETAAYHQLPPDYPAAADEEDAQGSPEPGPDAEPSDGVGIITLPPIRLVAARTASFAVHSSLGGKLTFPGKVCPKAGVGDWAVTYCLQGDGLSLAIEYKAKESLKLGVGFKLFAKQLRLRAGTVVKDGQMIDSGGILDGLEGFEINLAGGVENGAQDNVKAKIEVPVEIETASIVVGGIPLKMLVEAKFTIEPALSGRNSTLSGQGRYTLTGPIGIVDGKPLIPELTVDKSIVDSLTGMTIGPSGLVVAVKWKFQGGLGVYGFVAGPYLTMTISMGVGRGSVIGAPLAECHGATLGIWVGAGGGFSLSAKKMGWLFGKNSLMTKYLSFKQEIDLVQLEVLNKEAVSPDVPLCRD